MRAVLFTCIFSLLFLSCKQAPEIAYAPINTSPKGVITNPPGKKLMEQKCYACHSPKATMGDRLAPPMIAVKEHYINDSISKQDFANALWQWVENPKKEHAKMKGAIRRFGVMPYQPFNKKDITAIANYIYDNDIEKPEWFDDHKKEMKGKEH